VKIPIKTVEDHHEAYYFWRGLGMRNAVLLHFDAHIDLELDPPIESVMTADTKEGLKRRFETYLRFKERCRGERDPIDPGNYIYSAMRDGIVSDFYWIIPGDRGELDRSLEKVKDILRRISSRGASPAGEAAYSGGILTTKIYNRDLVVTTIEDLPRGIDNALIDIDTDYLTTDTIRRSDPRTCIGKRIPWLWPDRFVAELGRKRIEPLCVTVSYSVNGGYTPIIYKFLGDEVSALLNDAKSPFVDALSERSRAVQAFHKEDFSGSINILLGLAKKADGIKMDRSLNEKFMAHIHFLLFRCYAELGSRAEAKRHYRSSVALDGTYGARDNNYGPLYLGTEGRLGDAEREFRMILASDRGNPHALSGTAKVWLRKAGRLSHEILKGR